MVGNDLLLVVVVGNPPVVVLKAVNMVLPPPPVNLPMKEFGICVTLSNVGDPRALAGSDFILQSNRKWRVPSLCTRLAVAASQYTLPWKELWIRNF
jgi:hypothetical protein